MCCHWLSLCHLGVTATPRAMATTAMKTIAVKIVVMIAVIVIIDVIVVIEQGGADNAGGIHELFAQYIMHLGEAELKTKAEANTQEEANSKAEANIKAGRKRQRHSDFVKALPVSDIVADDDALAIADVTQTIFCPDDQDANLPLPKCIKLENNADTSMRVSVPSGHDT